MRRLRLDRPLVCFDLETTGTDIGRDRAVEIGLVRLEPDGRRTEWVRRVNPGGPIPPEATRVHGITDDDVRDAPKLAEIADELLALLAGADVAGFNSLGFDWPFLAAELERIGRPLDRAEARHVDAMRIFHQKEPRDLSAALRFYCGREHAGAHSALADAAATLDILAAQVARYDDLPEDVAGLHAFCGQGRENRVDGEGKLVWNEAGEAVFAFGKHKGRSLREVAAADPGYLRFLQREDLDRPFSSELRRIAREAEGGRWPERKPAAPARPPAEPPSRPAAPELPAAAAAPRGAGPAPESPSEPAPLPPAGSDRRPKAGKGARKKPSSQGDLFG
jgi:DNA polymerase-3 subunit epsilon